MALGLKKLRTAAREGREGKGGREGRVIRCFKLSVWLIKMQLKKKIMLLGVDMKKIQQKLSLYFQFNVQNKITSDYYSSMPISKLLFYVLKI